MGETGVGGVCEVGGRQRSAVGGVDKGRKWKPDGDLTASGHLRVKNDRYVTP
jgi:hypothetical protein